MLQLSTSVPTFVSQLLCICSLTQTVFSSDWDGSHMWEEWKLMVDCMAVVSKAVVEPKEKHEEEEDKEADVGEGSSTED